MYASLVRVICGPLGVYVMRYVPVGVHANNIIEPFMPVYQVLTGFLPFAGCSDLKVVSKLMKKELPADLHNTRLDPNHNFSEKLCELVGRCWSIEATRRPPCQAILRVLEGVTTIQRPRGPRLESFTTRNSLIHSRAWLRTPALIKAKEAENLLEKLYSG